MKVLNLYAGVGGNRKLWEGCEVTAVEFNEKIAEIYQQNNPGDAVVVGDAHQYLLEHHDEFDFIWSSPPCQTHSRMNKATRHKLTRYPDMRLYEEIVFLQHYFKGGFVVENVKPYYKPLIEAHQIGRHLFWANFSITADDVKRPRGFINKCNTKGKEELQEWLGIHYEGNVYYDGNHCPAQILRNCVHPELGLQILNDFKRSKK
ncbi:S-adenosyl-L-methionine-dependent methyltransferase [Vibrio phage 1.082.O._10N.261.49.E4]|nr:S-adenosyl-L-methionine-dependent methyltransferase [Vibrio phage 1.082.O._10N.261.49.E4]